MPRPTKLPLALTLLLCAPYAIAQSNLGELLDAGAKPLSPEEFKQEVVQRVIAGPTLTGASLEIMYAKNGEIQGVNVGERYAVPNPISGEWKIDDSGKVCTSLRIGGTNSLALPSRCQWWFKLAEQYFLSDSDSDRHARVLRRTLKQ